MKFPYIVTHYDQHGTKIISLRCKRIDIMESHSLFYYDLSDHLVYRTFSGIGSINIEAGIITVYYIDQTYIVIRKSND